MNNHKKHIYHNYYQPLILILTLNYEAHKKLSNVLKNNF